jgi:hypothetical protein
MVLLGDHGTTETRAALVKSSGFRIGGGRKGPGVYFWARDSLSKGLAVSWHSVRLKNGRYAGDKSLRCVVISVEIHVDKDETINLNDQAIKSRLLSLYSDRINKNNDMYNACLEEFFSRIENRSGKKLKVIVSGIRPPKDCKYPEFYGLPNCYIVRNTSCIINIAYEEVA